MNLTLPQQQLKTTQPDSYQKGLRFETYIKELFNERYFKLHKWRKAEKLPGSKFSFDISRPDLEMIFGRGKYRFAVECKWRKKFNDGKITWASSYQICSYEDFENQ